MTWLKKIRPILTIAQLNRLSNILDNSGQVIFGIAVVSPLFSEFDKVNWIIVLFGLVTALICWIASLILIRKRNYDI